MPCGMRVIRIRGTVEARERPKERLNPMERDEKDPPACPWKMKRLS